MTHTRQKVDWLAWGVAVLLVLLPLPRHWMLLRQEFPGVFYEFSSLRVYVGDVVVLVLLGGEGIGRIFNTKGQRGKGRKEGREKEKGLFYRSGKRVVYLLLVGLTLVTGLSSLWALDVTLALQQGVRLLVLLAWVRLLAVRRPHTGVVRIGVGVSLVVQAGAALLQFMRQDDLGLRFLGEINLHRYPGGGSILMVGETYWLRGYGLTPHPNILGGVLVVLLLVGTAVYLHTPTRSKVLWLPVLLMGVAGLVVSFSRSAWLGGMVGGGFLVGMVMLKKVWRQEYGRSLLLFGLLMILAASTLLWSQRALLLTRVDTGGTVTEARSINERQALADMGTTFFQMAPLTGIGAANFAVAAIPFTVDQPDVSAQPVHHIPRLLAAELGIVGSLIWVGLMVAPAVIAINQYRHGRLTVWAMGLTAALMAFAVIDLFDYYAWGWAQGQLLRWLLWGLWLAAVAGPPTPSASP